MGYQEELRAVLDKYPEILAINVDLRKTLVIQRSGDISVDATMTYSAPTLTTEPHADGYVAPSGLKPVINPPVSPELIKKLKGGAYEESVKVLNA